VNSYADYLQPFFPYVPSGLISAQCLDRVSSVTQHLPAALGIGPFMFECSLDDRPAADFSVAVMASRGDHAVLSQQDSTGITPPLDNPDWTRIRQFARSWMDASSLLGHMVEEVWLEFDVCLTSDAPSNTPSVFFRLEYQSPQDLALRRTLPGEYVRAAKEGLDILAGRRASPATLSIVADCFYMLPPSARILFIGAMISRGTDTVRVVASRLRLEDMVQYLERLGLRKPVGHHAPIANISNLVDHLWLAIDIEETGVTRRIGFDCYYNGSTQPGNNTKWADLLEFLVDNGFCTEDKRNALLDAADMSNRKLDEPAWPVGLRRLSKILGPAGLNRMRLGIHHIKVIDRPGVPLEAKAYLCGSYN
jgi:hypothetical protein